ncbi:glutamine--fructose-6-phosphate transaminase (isomerizing), partial [Gonapodya sp. JEL0774]
MMAIVISEDNPKKAARRAEIIDALHELPDQVRRVLALDIDIKTMVAQYYPKDRNSVIIGRGHQFATCLEGALKIKEITYMATDGVQAGELKHGPMALIEPALGIILIMTDNILFPEAESAFEQVRARGGQPIIICNEGDKRIPAACTPLGWLESLMPSSTVLGKKQRTDWMGARALRIPKTVDALEGILTVVPLQLMAYHIAVNQNKDPDNPRNLA